VIDLHTHSTWSDGSEPPGRVVELAAVAGCTAVALTDHDSLFGLVEAQAAAEAVGIRLVPGCEVSCTSEAGPTHLLCYFVTDSPNPLTDLLERLRADREERNERILERLAGLGIALSYDEVRAEGHGPVVGRPHIAAALVRSGAAGSFAEAFNRYLATGASAFVPRTAVNPATVIRDARASGAVTALAHPPSLGLSPDRLDALVAGLTAAGLSGLEAHYARYDEATRVHLAHLAVRHGLVATGGSDFHGANRPDIAVGVGTGDLEVPDACLDELAARIP
jgi:predicted metal-dependent phosphoesterase TrpH